MRRPPGATDAWLPDWPEPPLHPWCNLILVSPAAPIGFVLLLLFGVVLGFRMLPLAGWLPFGCLCQDFLSKNQWEEGATRLAEARGLGKLEKQQVVIWLADAFVWADQQADEGLACRPV